jgi:hypothetical protein
MTDYLEPCSKCSGEAGVEEKRRGLILAPEAYRVRCATCDHAGAASSDREEAIDWWNVDTRFKRIMAERDAASGEAARLRGAIEKHRAARGQDRCRENDTELYAALGDDYAEDPHAGLCSREEWLEGCGAYFDSQQPRIAK